MTRSTHRALAQHLCDKCAGLWRDDLCVATIWPIFSTDGVGGLIQFPRCGFRVIASFSRAAEREGTTMPNRAG